MLLTSPAIDTTFGSPFWPQGLGSFSFVSWTEIGSHRAIMLQNCDPGSSWLWSSQCWDVEDLHQTWENI